MGRCRRNCKDSKPYLASACLLSHIVLFDFCWAKHHIAMSFVLVLVIFVLFVCLFVCFFCCCCSRRCCLSYCCDVGGANFVCRVSFLDKPTQVRNLSWECCKSRFVSVSVLLHYWFACSWMRCSWSWQGRMKVVTQMSSNVFPKNYISKNTDVLHMFFLRKNSPYQQLSSLNDGTHLQSSDIWEVKDQGWTSLPCQTPVTTLGLCSRKRKLFLQIFHGFKLKHIRCCATPPWPTYWSKTHWKDLMFAFNPQRQQRQAVKSVKLQTWARTVHTSFHEGAIYFQFTIIRLRCAEWSELLWFFVAALPPPQQLNVYLRLVRLVQSHPQQASWQFSWMRSLFDALKTEGTETP